MRGKLSKPCLKYKKAELIELLKNYGDTRWRKGWTKQKMCDTLAKYTDTTGGARPASPRGLSITEGLPDVPYFTQNTKMIDDIPEYEDALASLRNKSVDDLDELDYINLQLNDKSDEEKKRCATLIKKGVKENELFSITGSPDICENTTALSGWPLNQYNFDNLYLLPDEDTEKMYCFTPADVSIMIETYKNPYTGLNLNKHIYAIMNKWLSTRSNMTPPLAIGAVNVFEGKGCPSYDLQVGNLPKNGKTTEFYAIIKSNNDYNQGVITRKNLKPYINLFTPTIRFRWYSYEATNIYKLTTRKPAKTAKIKHVKSLELVYTYVNDEAHTLPKKDQIIHDDIVGWVSGFTSSAGSNIPERIITKLEAYPKLRPPLGTTITLYRGLSFPSLATLKDRIGKDNFTMGDVINHKATRATSWASMLCEAVSFSLIRKYGLVLRHTFNASDVIIDTRTLEPKFRTSNLYYAYQSELIIKPGDYASEVVMINYSPVRTPYRPAHWWLKSGWKQFD